MKFEKFMSALFAILIGTAVILLAWVFFYAMPRDFERTYRGKEIAEQMGCQYIGSARDLNTIKFIDCDGQIKMIRVK